MKMKRFAAAAVLAAAAAVTVHASDMIGVYGRIEKVVMEPGEQSPQRVQVWGVFALADPKNPRDYLAPVRGYLYYTLPGDSRMALREWSDLKSVAGTGQIVGFGTRYGQSRGQVRVRKADEHPQGPDPYSTDIGLRKVRGETDYAPVRAILDFHP